MKEREEFKQLPEENSSKLESEGKELVTIKSVERFRKKQEFLKNNYSFRFNIVTDEIEYCLKNISKDEQNVWRPLTDRDLADIATKLELKGLPTTEPKIKSILLSSDISKAYDPYKEYLFSLEKYDDGEKDYIKKWLEQVELENENERKDFVLTFKKWFVGLTASWIKTKAINHHCLVLTGPQGRYKTTFLNRIMPPVLSDYLYVGDFDFKSKDYIKYLGTKGLINLDELSSLSRTEITDLKVCLTQSQIEIRKAYARLDTKMERRASFCGSTNDGEFLTDETGNRRFLIVKIKNIKLNENLKIDDLYRQAFYLVKTGFKYWFDGEDIKKINEHNESFFRRSMEEELISKYVKNISTEDIENIGSKGSFYHTATDINIFISEFAKKLNLNELTKKRTGQILQKLGFEQRTMRRGATTQRFYLCELLSQTSHLTPEELIEEKVEEYPI